MIMAYCAFLVYLLIRLFIAGQVLRQSFLMRFADGYEMSVSEDFSVSQELSIIIPVHSEVGKLAPLYEQWSKISSEFTKVKIRVYFVFPHRKQSFRLVEKFQSLVESFPCQNIVYLNDSSSDSTKCSKVDCALGAVPELSWVGIVDCDTRVDLCAIAEVLELLQQDKVVQLVPLSEFISGSRVGALYRSMRVYRNIFLEQLMGIRCWKDRGFRPFAGFRYMCGASMFFHREIYLRYGPFPDWNDDMYLGYALGADNEGVAVCQQFSISPFPAGFKNVFWHRVRIRYMSLKAGWHTVTTTPFRLKRLFYSVVGLAGDLNKELNIALGAISLFLFDGGCLIAIFFLLFLVELIEYFSVLVRIKRMNSILRYSAIDHFIILPVLSFIELLSAFVAVFLVDVAGLSKRVTAK